MPADGWYEWKKDEANPKLKQPYYITLSTGEPMFFLQHLEDSSEAAHRSRVMGTVL